MNWTITRKMALIGVILFISMIISAGNAYFADRAIQNAASEAYVRNNQFNLLKKLNTAYDELMTLASDAIINKNRGEIGTETMNIISSYIEFFENNFKQLENIADTHEEKALVNHIRHSFPLLAESIRTELAGYDSPDALLADEISLAEHLCMEDTHTCNKFERILGENERAAGVELQMTRRDDKKVWMSMSARAVRDVSGTILFYEGSLADITEHKEKEKAERKREIAEAENKKIMESIGYAKLIQQSLLPNPEIMKTYLPDSFFIWIPRDMVSGDFIFTDYLSSVALDEKNHASSVSLKKTNFIILAVIDCTGHGVAGAFMTMIASSALRRIVKEETCHDPAEILKRLNSIVKTTLQQDGEHAISDHGLDAAVISIECAKGTKDKDQKAHQLTFAGAKMPMVYIRNNEICVVKGDKQSIGYKQSRKSDIHFNFTNHNVTIEPDMAFYIYSDGVTDQLGGERERPLGSRYFKKLLKSIASLPFEKQQKQLLDAFYAHKQDNEVQDDVTVVGFGIAD